MRQAVVDQGSQPFRNNSWDPRATRFSIAEAKQPSFWNNRWTAFTSFSLVTGATDGPAGITTYARATVTGTQTGIGFHLAENPEVSSPSGILLAPALPGETVILSLWVRSSVAVSINLQFRAGTGGAWAAAASSTLTPVTAGVWQRISKTYTVPAGTVTGLGIYVTFTGTAPAIGTTLDVTGMNYLRGVSADPGMLVDGSTPGWRWTGTPGLSPSIGYPYTLQSIAGTPDVVMSAIASTTSASLSSIGATQGRTLYVVHDVPTLANSPVVARFGSNIGGIARARLLYTGAHVQWDGFNNADATIALVNQLNARAIGRHTAVLMVSEGVTQIVGQLDGGIENIATINSASDRTIPSAGVYGHTNTDASAIYLVAYRGEHNLETRKRITAWLARMYGSPIPSGY